MTVTGATLWDDLLEGEEIAHVSEVPAAAGRAASGRPRRARRA
jgi:hypothetical protein